LKLKDLDTTLKNMINDAERMLNDEELSNL